MDADGAAAVAVQAFGRGLVIAATAGAVAGTMVIPLIGTIFGLLTGVAYGVIPSAVGALVVAGVLMRLPRSDVATVRSHLRRAVYIYGVVVWLACYPFLALVPGGFPLPHLVAVWLATGAVIAAFLPMTAQGLAASYAKRRQR